MSSHVVDRLTHQEGAVTALRGDVLSRKHGKTVAQAGDATGRRYSGAANETEGQEETLAPSDAIVRAGARR